MTGAQSQEAGLACRRRPGTGSKIGFEALLHGDALSNLEVGLTANLFAKWIMPLSGTPMGNRHLAPTENR